MDHILFHKELFIHSTFEGLNKCLNIVNEIKEIFDLDVDAVFALHTVIVESVENAFIHGNKGRREAEVRFLILVYEMEIIIEVEDMGDGFDIDNIPSPSFRTHIDKEGGRGIYFIKILSDSCSTVGRGNIIRIKLKR
jgi:serine/threonine-protein kinase RsbW